MSTGPGATSASPTLSYYQLRQVTLSTLRSFGIRTVGSMTTEAIETIIAQLHLTGDDLVFCDVQCPDFLAYLASNLIDKIPVALAPPLDESLSADDVSRLQASLEQKITAFVGSHPFAPADFVKQRIATGQFKQVRHASGGRLRQGTPAAGLALPASAVQFLGDPLWVAVCAAFNEEAARKRGRPRKYPLPTAAIWWTSIPAADKTTMAFWEMNRHVCSTITLEGSDRSALFLLSPEETTAVEMAISTSGATEIDGKILESRRVGFGEIFANGQRYCPEWYLDSQNTRGEAPLGEVAVRIGRGTTLSGKTLPLEGSIIENKHMANRITDEKALTRPSWMPRTSSLIEWGNLLRPEDICYLEASGIRENGTIKLQLMSELPPQQERYVITPEDGPVILIPRDGDNCVLVHAPCTILLANSIFAIRLPRMDGEPIEPDVHPKRRGRKPKFATASACISVSPAYVEVFLRSGFGKQLLAQLPKPLGKNELASLPIPLLSPERQQEVIDRDQAINRAVAHERERAERLLAIMNEAAAASRFE